MTKKAKTGEALKESLIKNNKEIQLLFDLSNAEKREFTPEEKTQFKTLQKEVKSIEQELEKIEEEENKLIKVQFLKSPTGIYNLGYNAGEKAKVRSVIAKQMFADGTAKKVK